MENRMPTLLEKLAGIDSENIILIGHSEGAATVGALLNAMADGDYADTNWAKNIKGAALLDGPFGILQSAFVLNWDSRCLDNLPARLNDAGYDIRLVDIWNQASVVHGNQIPGWEENSHPYNSRSTFGRIISNASRGHPLTYALYRGLTQGAAHDDPLHNSAVTDIIEGVTHD